MEITIEQNAVVEKTRELCQTILDTPEFQHTRRAVESFMSNEEAKTQYESLASKGEYLQHKQQQGLPLDGAEINDYEALRTAFLGNPIARGFLDAQQAMHKMQETVGQYVTKTFELGRVPNAEDFDSGDCGPSCGCSH